MQKNKASWLPFVGQARRWEDLEAEDQNYNSYGQELAPDSEGLGLIQAIQLHFIELVDRLCQRQGLRYYLLFDSLSRALRHWEAPYQPDCCLALPREDYRRLRLALEERESEERYTLGLHPYFGDSLYFRILARRAKLQLERPLPLDLEQQGPGLLILPMDEALSEPEAEARRQERIQVLIRALAQKEQRRHGAEKAGGEEREGGVDWLSYLPLLFLQRRLDQLLEQGRGQEAEHWALYAPQAGLSPVCYLPKQSLEPSSKLPAGHRFVRVPAGAHELQTRLYGARYREQGAEPVPCRYFGLDSIYWADVIHG